MAKAGIKSRETVSEAEPIVTSYAIERRGNGWAIREIETQGQSVVRNEIVGEPDMWPITFEKLRAKVRKEG